MFRQFFQRPARLLMAATVVVAFGAGVMVSSPAGAQERYTMGNADIAAVYEEVSQAVVHINVVQVVERSGSPFGFQSLPSPDTPEGGEPPQGFQFQLPQQDVPEFYRQGLGSGFVIDTEGHVVTNYHVIQGASRMEVAFRDGTLTRAEVIGGDPESDIAVLKLSALPENVRPLTFADSSALYVGQPVLAIGSPFGQDWTLTTGIVSALGRTISSGYTSFSISSAIQTDAAINPGNSGGPLLDINGNVIGVNAQIISSARASAGVGFAIPANLVQKVVNALIETGEVKYAWLGISGQSLNLDLIEALELPADQRGVLVDQVTAGGPARAAGLRGNDSVVQYQGQQLRVGGDIITAVNGEPIRFMDDLITYLVENTEPGDQITLTVLRGAETLELEVTLGERSQAQ